jgi:hypothetical protein
MVSSLVRGKLICRLATILTALSSQIEAANIPWGIERSWPRL